MTSFVAWTGVDTHGPASIYLASDSRISWSASDLGKVATWDYGRKVFASQQSADLLGYVGDVLFPSLVLGQIIAAIDHGAMFGPRLVASERFSKIRDAIQRSFVHLPLEHQRDFSIVYATREGTGTRCNFLAWVLHWTKKSGWAHEDLPMPQESGAITILGSGAYIAERWRHRWDSTSQGRTSRAVFASFCDAVESASDPLSGGAVQLVGLYRIGPGRTTGVVRRGQPYLCGLPVDPEGIDPDGVLEWRNALFEHCTPSGHRLDSAQPHHRPKGLGNWA